MNIAVLEHAKRALDEAQGAIRIVESLINSRDSHGEKIVNDSMLSSLRFNTKHLKMEVLNPLLPFNDELQGDVQALSDRADKAIFRIDAHLG
ncbi:MAG: hypothetical protein HGA67_03580 [Candidatus Yonathbacteria bacterium]|nr:hypothetical protein [Candidatus Yonathbacteria bacterium]